MMPEPKTQEPESMKEEKGGINTQISGATAETTGGAKPKRTTSKDAIWLGPPGYKSPELKAVVKEQKIGL